MLSNSGISLTDTINQLADAGNTGLAIGGGTVEIRGAGTFAGGSFPNTINNNGTFKYNSTIDNALNGPLVGTGTLVKDNTSTLTLNGPNYYSGPTTVQNGTLEVNHYVMPSAVTLQPGTTLAGSGGTGPVTINGGNYTTDWYVVTIVDASLQHGEAAVTLSGTLSYRNGSGPALVQAMSATDAVFSALGATVHGGTWNSVTGATPGWGGFYYNPNFSVNDIGPIQAIAFEDWKDGDYNDGYFEVEVVRISGDVDTDSDNPGTIDHSQTEEDIEDANPGKLLAVPLPGEQAVAAPLDVKLINLPTTGKVGEIKRTRFFLSRRSKQTGLLNCSAAFSAVTRFLPSFWATLPYIGPHSGPYHLPRTAVAARKVAA